MGTLLNVYVFLLLLAGTGHSAGGQHDYASFFCYWRETEAGETGKEESAAGSGIQLMK